MSTSIDRIARSQWLSAINDNLERFALVALYIYIITVVVLEVFRRYVMSYSSLWGSETAMYMFIYMSWIGMSWAAYKRVHIRMNLLYQFAGDRAKAYLYIVSDVAMVVFAVLSVQYIYPLIRNSIRFQRQVSSMDISMYVFQLAIPLGMTLFLFRTFQRLYGDVRAVRNDETPFEGEALFETDTDD